jgi:hypothetical protein
MFSITTGSTTQHMPDALGTDSARSGGVERQACQRRNSCSTP